MILHLRTLRKLRRTLEFYELLSFESLQPVAFEFQETKAHHRRTPADGVWRRIEVGESWGAEWANGWFRTEVTLPPDAAGRRVYLRADTGTAETILFVDEVPYGVLTPNYDFSGCTPPYQHREALLTPMAEPGRKLTISLEAYAGHSHPGTQPPRASGNVMGAEFARPTYRGAEVVAERTDVMEFCYDLLVLLDLVDALEANSLRRAKVAKGLAEVWKVLPAEPQRVAEDDWRQAMARAREIMAPLLARKNGPTAPVFGIIGHSHIDTAWLWPISETDRKIARSASNYLALMELDPKFRALMSAPYHMERLRTEYPELYTRIAERTREARFEVNGAMWIEPDGNIPSGESFVRQLLYAQRWTREQFGQTMDTLWLPDTFGYSAALPQILRQGGVPYFCTTKLSWNDTNKFPYDMFHWQGIDGSRVLAHLNVMDLEGPSPKTLTLNWNRVQHKDVQDRVQAIYGFGDGGNGPHRRNMEYARRVEDLEGIPRAKSMTVSEFMQGAERDLGSDLPVWMGELYLELHRGTLTSQAWIKRHNRRNEFLLHDAEFLWAMAWKNGAEWPEAEFERLWKDHLLHQFHDILPGTSIQRVNEEAVAAMGRIGEEVEALAQAGAEALDLKGDGRNQALMLVNTLGWDRSGPVELMNLPEGYSPGDHSRRWQAIRKPWSHETIIVAGQQDIPAMGSRILPLQHISLSDTLPPSPFSVHDGEIETSRLIVRYDSETGAITSMFDKALRRECVAEGGAINLLQFGEDVPELWDVWDIDSDQEHKLETVQPMGPPDIVSEGPLQLRLRWKFHVGRKSEMIQDMVLRNKSPQVDFEAVIDWREEHTLLKARFDLAPCATEARHEIQFGHVKRPTHRNMPEDRARFETCCHKWSDISEPSFGVALLNDGKYGVGAHETTLTLSLLKGGIRPDPRGDAARHIVRYAVRAHDGFSVANVVKPAYEFNLAPMHFHCATGAEPIQPPFAFEAETVIIDAIKRSEDGRGLIVRLYEAGGRTSHATLRFSPGATVEETNLLEDVDSALPVDEKGALSLTFRPFQLRTLKVG
ncbi:MAG: glycoside hydrolase family 38 C-terminal domain-containing protein [Sumerlaeia bacterium]